MKRNTLPAIERNLFLPALAGFFVAGIWLAAKVSAGLWPLWILPISVLLLIPLRLLRLPLRLACLPIALMFALFWTQHWLNPSMPAEGKYDSITATVYGDSHISSSGNLVFIVTDIAQDETKWPGKAYAVYYLDDHETLALKDGIRIRFNGKVYRPSGKENEYDFDFPMWMAQSGLHYGISGIKNMEILSSDTPWTDYAQRIAKESHERLQTVMGENADLAVAMLLGYRDALAEDDAQAFQRAGVAHVMAVSGLHVGILSMALLWLLKRMRIRRKLQVVVVAVFLFFYCGITGFAVASMRAAVMVLLWLIARASGRKPNSITVFSTAMLIVLVINPLQLFSAGFAMSFGAIAGIALLYPRLMQVLDHVYTMPKVRKDREIKYILYRIVRYFKPKQTLAVCLSAQLGVLLPIITYYHHIYLCGFILNLLIVPIVSMLVPLYAITLLLLWIPWIGEILAVVPGIVAGLGSKCVLWMVHTSGLFPWAVIRMARPNGWTSLAYYLCMLTASHFVRAPLRKQLAAIGLMLVIALAGSYAQRPPSLRYYQFSVGSADSALIIDGDITVGIDTGSTGSTMANRLLAENRDLDVLILTHLHLDHAGGVAEILKDGIHIGQVYLPADYEKHECKADSLAVVQLLKEAGIPVACLAAGDMLQFHETTIDVLWPQQGHTREEMDANDRSLAMLLTLGNVRILTMGDNGNLYENYAAIPADVLKVGHHGSKSSTGKTFIHAVQPTFAMISVRGTGDATTERLQEEEVRVLRTDETGEITIVPTAGGYRIYRYIAEETD